MWSEAITKLDLLGHHMWEKVFLGFIVHTQGGQQRPWGGGGGGEQALLATSLGSINNG